MSDFECTREGCICPSGHSGLQVETCSLEHLTLCMLARSGSGAQFEGTKLSPIQLMHAISGPRTQLIHAPMQPLLSWLFVLPASGAPADYWTKRQVWHQGRQGVMCTWDPSWTPKLNVLHPVASVPAPYQKL